MAGRADDNSGAVEPSFPFHCVRKVERRLPGAQEPQAPGAVVGHVCDENRTPHRDGLQQGWPELDQHLVFGGHNSTHNKCHRKLLAYRSS